MEHENYRERSSELIGFAAAALALMLVAWLVGAVWGAPAAPWETSAAPVATLQPTPAITVPPGSTLKAAEPQITGDNSGNVTITNNYTWVDVDTCIALICPPDIERQP